VAKKIPVINRPEQPLSDKPRGPSGAYVPTTPWERQLRESLEDALRPPSNVPDESYEEWDEQNRPYTYSRIEQETSDSSGDLLDLSDDIDVEVTRVPRDYPIDVPPGSELIVGPDTRIVLDDVIDAVTVEGPFPNQQDEDVDDDVIIGDDIDIIVVPSRDKVVFVDWTNAQTFEVDLNQEPCKEYLDAIREFQAKRRYETSKVQPRRTKAQKRQQAIRTHYYFQNKRRQCFDN